jgi:multimeric flavodoxin WrbA
MLVIGVNGSPNPNHNTGFLVRKALEGAGQRGAQTRLFDLGRMRIGPCIACMKCKKTGACGLKDDMLGFHDTVRHATALVLATPVYFDHVTAQFKTFLDRLYCYLGPDMEKNFPKNVRAGIVITYGDNDPVMYDGIIEWIKGRMSLYFGVETVGSVKAAGCPQTLTVDRDQESVDRTLDLGRLLASQQQ